MLEHKVQFPKYKILKFGTRVGPLAIQMLIFFKKGGYSKMKRFLVVLFVAFLFFPLRSFGSEKLPGKYELIGDIDKAFGREQVTLTEFFNFSCGHCYKFLSSSRILHKKYGNRLIHKKVPIYWGKQSPFPAIAFYLAQIRGSEAKITQSIFDANFLGGAQIFDPRVVNFILSDLGINVDIRSQNDLRPKVQEGMSLAEKFSTNETPTVIINEVIKVVPSLYEGSIAKMTENLDLIINKLLQK